MIHLVVVLSAVVVAPSDVVPAVRSTTHSSPLLSAIALPLGHSSMHFTIPISTSATQTTPVFTPTPSLTAVVRSPAIARLQSKDFISPLQSFQQINKNNTALPYASLWEQVWHTHLWKCIHLNLMKQSLLNQTKYNKELMQTNSTQIEAQTPEKVRQQMSHSKALTNNSELIQWIRMSTDYTHTPQAPMAKYHQISPIQTPSVNNRVVPQTTRNGNISPAHIQRLRRQSSIKYKQQISQTQTSMKNKYGGQKHMSTQRNEQKSQRLSDKDTKHMSQTSTDMTKQLLKTKMPIGFSADRNQIEQPYDKHTQAIQVPVHRNKRQQVLKRPSSWLLHDNNHQMKTQEPPPSHSSIGSEASILFSQLLVKNQAQVLGLKHSLKLPLFLMTLNNWYGGASKNDERKWQYIYHSKINVKQQLTVHSNIDNHVSSADITLACTKNILKKSINIHHSSNDAFDMDHNIHNNSSSDPISNHNMLSGYNSNSSIPINDGEIPDVTSARLLDIICSKNFNKACIFRRRSCIESVKDDSDTSTTAAKINDRTINRDSRPSSSSKSLTHNSSSNSFSISNSSNIFNSNKAATKKITENVSSSTSVQSKSSTNIFNSDRKQKSKRRICKRGRVRRSHGYRRLDHRRNNNGREQRQEQHDRDLSLWIDRKQVRIFSGYMMEIYAIHNGRVLPYILDPNFEKQLPVIPSEVENVNFTWRAGSKRYYYTFDRLYSQDEEVLEVPVLSLPIHGTVPRKPKVFSVKIQCTGNSSGIATFGIGLLIQTRLGKPLPGTPLRLKLRKNCTQLGPDPECDQKCENGGVCDEGQRCLCPEGYMGQYCNTALCYPQCMNGGTCTTPGRCSCPPGFQGRHCEGGMCQNKCQNGGKCVQKDTCDCRRGYYGNRCEFSKCVIPCVNGGRCRDVNKCRCPLGFTGDHCEVVLGPDVKATATSRCSRRCRHGTCKKSTCYCHEGYTGRWCRRRGRRMRGRQGKKVWV